MKFINLLDLNRWGLLFRQSKALMGVFGLFLIFFSQSSFGQSGSLLDIPTNGGMVPSSFKINSIGGSRLTIEAFYLDSVWAQTDVYLVMDSMILKGLKTRIDLKNNLLEVKCDDEIKVFPSFRIRSIFYPKSETTFVTENILKVVQKGFYKIVVTNDKSLLCRYDAKMLRSNYNVLLDVGDNKDKIVKNKNYFLFSNNKLVRLKKSSKKIRKQFKTNPIVADYLSKHETNPKLEYSLIQFTDYLNIKEVQL